MKNQKGVVSMGMIVFFACSFLTFVGVTVWYTLAGDTKADKVEAQVKEIDSELSQLSLKVSKELAEIRKELEARDQDAKKLVEILLQNDSHGEKLKQKLEWLEMKVSNAPKASSTLVLSQDKPLQVQVIYKKPKKKKKVEDTKKSVNDKVIKDIKSKMKELSQ